MSARVRTPVDVAAAANAAVLVDQLTVKLRGYCTSGKTSPALPRVYSGNLRDGTRPRYWPSAMDIQQFSGAVRLTAEETMPNGTARPLSAPHKIPLSVLITSKAISILERRVHCSRQSLGSIAAPLLDLMEIITVDGYAEDETVAIARNHLLAQQPRDREKH